MKVEVDCFSHISALSCERWSTCVYSSCVCCLSVCECNRFWQQCVAVCVCVCPCIRARVQTCAWKRVGAVGGVFLYVSWRKKWTVSGLLPQQQIKNIFLKIWLWNLFHIIFSLSLTQTWPLGCGALPFYYKLFDALQQLWNSGGLWCQKVLKPIFTRLPHAASHKCSGWLC